MASGSSSILLMYPQNGQAMGISDRRALEAAGVRANYGHGQGHGGGDDGQVGRCRPVVGQVGDRVRPAAVSYGQDATTMK